MTSVDHLPNVSKDPRIVRVAYLTVIMLASVGIWLLMSPQVWSTHSSEHEDGGTDDSNGPQQHVAYGLRPPDGAILGPLVQASIKTGRVINRRATEWAK